MFAVWPKYWACVQAPTCASASNMSGHDGNIGIDSSKRPLTVNPSFAAYAEKHNVFELLEEMTKDLVVTQPEDPLEHLLSFLRQQPVPRVFVHGPIGSGRKALSSSICDRTHAVALEVDDVVKAAVDQETEHGIAAKPYVESGDPIPNAILVSLVVDRLREGDCKRNGFVLRGFPKTRAQAVALQIQGVLPTHVFILEGTSEASATQYLEKLKETGECSRMPTRFEITDSIEEFRLNLHSFSTTFVPVVTRLDARQTPEDIFAAAWSTLCTKRQSNAPFIPRLVIIGPRGSGDREQADALARKYGAIAVHFQDVLQKAADVGNAVSRTINQSFKNGTPIPDSTLHDLIKAEISQFSCQTKGWILTGYPKTASQARALVSDGLAPNRSFFLDVEKNTAIDRQEGQQIDPVSGKMYHAVYNPAIEADVASRLVQHPANRSSEVERTLDAYSDNFDELSKCFPNYVRIDANFDSETVLGYIDGHMVRPQGSTFAGV